ncbi:MAG TPA: hypothetical protein VF802_00545 [Candidatus Limnocylindrales bacterium]
MPFWHCPHCGTPQPEAARCWVCRRSSTTCGTCRHYRRAVAGQLGYCGLDRRRDPRRGDEIRGCWESATDAAAAGASRPITVLVRPTTARTWTEVGATAEPGGIVGATGSNAPAESSMRASIIDAPPPSLWSDAEA